MDELEKHAMNFMNQPVQIPIKNLNYEDKPEEMEVLQFDPITPSHYHKNEIDVHGYLQKHFPKEGTYTVAEGFHIGNVIKYVSRYKDKNGIEDLKKAEANLKILIELSKGE